MTTSKLRPPKTALHGLTSYEENGALHHAGPFGVAVDGDEGWAVRGIDARLDEADAVHMVATGAPRRADFGTVLIIGGQYRGKLGYYDDDDDENPGRVAIVYFGEPFSDDFALVPFRHLVNVDVALVGVERYRRDAPDTAAVMGVPSRARSSPSQEPRT